MASEMVADRQSAGTGNHFVLAEAENVSKSFGSVVANDSVSLQLKAGQIHALLGENGAGKSTLASILTGLYNADSGQVCGQGIEMRAKLTATTRLHKKNTSSYEPRHPYFIYKEPTRLQPREYLATVGLSLDDDGNNVSENINLAARRALLEMIDYLGSRGYSTQQAYAICGTAVDLRISEVVDVPNAIVSAFVPLDIFE